MKLVIGILICCICWNSPVHTINYNKLSGAGEPNSPMTRNAIPIDYWFVQKLDHFNYTDKRTWRQRYLKNSEYYKNGGPVFLLVGGEDAISKRWMYSGAWIEYAKEFKALCFQLEHRYYGLSRPTEDTSTKNLVYLNTEQALADLAEFIVNIKSKYNIPSTAKWVAFGGSYPGSLAAWLRLKYPHLIHAAVSSSAPLLAAGDFKEYFEVVANSLAAYKPECVSQIKRATQMINHLLKNNKGAKIIEDKFKMCSPINRQNKRDVATLFALLAHNFAEIVQYNKNNRLYENPERGLITVETICDIMVDKSTRSPLDRYAAVNTKLLYLNKATCRSYTYKKVIDYYKNTAWKIDKTARQWYYQSCTELGFFQTSKQPNHVFGQNFPIDYFVDMCMDIFGKSFNSKLISEGVKRTNMLYGELDTRESRVLFVHGSIDPWHALGITHERTKHNVAIFMNGTAHCADMYPPVPKDPPVLKNARTKIRGYLKEWLLESDFIDSAHAVDPNFDFDN